jgi:hypothetical protein
MPKSLPDVALQNSSRDVVQKLRIGILIARDVVQKLRIGILIASTYWPRKERTLKSCRAFLSIMLFAGVAK